MFNTEFIILFINLFKSADIVILGAYIILLKFIIKWLKYVYYNF